MLTAGNHLNEKRPYKKIKGIMNGRAQKPSPGYMNFSE